MDIKYQFRNLEQVEAVKQKAPAFFEKNMIVAAKVASEKVASQARAIHLFRSRSGHSDMGIEPLEPTVNQYGVVGIVRLNPQIPQLTYQHEGTGIYGPNKRPIRPTRKKVLRWADASGFRYAKQVKGIRPDKFLYRAGEKSQKSINDIFNRYADRACKEVGL